jgi:protein-tyrosine phosphatase
MQLTKKFQNTFMKIRTLISCLILLVFESSSAIANTASILTFDKSEITNDHMPRNFRDLSVIGINAIASAQFSEDELQEVRKKYPNEKIVIVDLRQESHGFINGKSVLWRSYFEKMNQDKNISEILSDEKSRFRIAKKDREIVINEVTERDRTNGWYKSISPKIVAVKKAMNEKDLAKENGFEYQRFSVRDFDKPDGKEFSRMVSFIKNLPQDKKLYVHCAGGKGRTAMFLVTLDIIKNGKKTELTEIFKRQNKLGGARLDEISQEEAWSEELAKERLKMLEDFYKMETK